MFNPVKIILTAAIILLPLSTTACGRDPGERAASGAGIGAGAGLVGAALGAPLLPAVIVGGAAGAVTGAATSPKQINLDR